MSSKRQKSQLLLAFAAESRDEFPTTADEGIELPVAKRNAQSPTQTESLMEEVCQRDNLWQALKRVQANKGAPGVDGMTVRKLPKHLKRHWPKIREQLLAGTYRPQPVKRVEIPKPDGGVRKLGIPTALDRFIQQAVLQVLQARWDRTFSQHSYGFRPRRSAHQAVAQAQAYIAEGYGVTVDIDLEKFFDRVNHDMLMGRVAKRVDDKRMLKLIRAFLNAGVMENGLVSSSEEGTPQGGPLSPLLSNLMLDDLDRELERRGLRFVRYADDCNIYVRSRRAGERVMQSITRFITGQPQAQGERVEKRGGSTGGTEVPGLQLYERQTAETAHCAEVAVAVQEARAGTDETEPGRELGANGRTTGPLPGGLARLLRLLRDAVGASRPGLVDTQATPLLPMEAMETRQDPLRGTPQTGRGPRLGAQTAGSWRACGTSAVALP